MYKEIISHVNLWKHTVNGKFIIVFTEWTCYIVFVVAWLIFFAEYRDVVICTVHCRTHKVYRTGINSNILFVYMFFMNCFCYESAIWCEHETPKLCKYCHISHSCRYHYLIKFLVYTLTDNCYIVWLFILCIRDSDPTGEVDELNLNSCLFFKLYSEFKEDSCKCRIVIIAYCITGKKWMYSEIFCSHWFKSLESFYHLLFCHAILGIPRVVHDVCSHLEHSARIVTTTDSFRNSCCFVEEIYMCNIIKVYICTEFFCFFVLGCRCNIWWKHYIIILKTASLWHHKLREWWTINTASLFLEKF